MSSPANSFSMSVPASIGAPGELTPAAERDAAEADAIALNELENKLRSLEAKALELQATVLTLEAELGPEACQEIAKAQGEVALMRATVDTARSEISNAQTDKSGKKKITASSVAKLSDAVGHMIVAADAEKKALVDAATSDEKKEVKKTVVAAVAKCAAGVISTASHAVHKLPGLAAGAPARGAVHGPSVMVQVEQHVATATSYAKDAWAKVTASPIVQSVKEGASTAWNMTVDVVTHPVETAKAIGKAADNAYDSVATAASNAASYVKNGAVSAYESVALAASEYVGKPVAKAYDSTVAAAKGAKDWVVGLFGGKDEPKAPVVVAVAKPAPKPANDNKPDSSMLHALKQVAASVSLTAVAGGHYASEILTPSVPNLTGIQQSLSHFWQ